jgi:magnesium-transporting ATPase (P-type)
LCGNNEISKKKIISANPTDKAICEFIKEGECKGEVIDKIPFDSTKKYSATVIKEDGKKLTLFKGAPEKILNASQKYMDVYGALRDFNTKERAFADLKEYTTSSYRVVAMAMKEGDSA